MLAIWAQANKACRERFQNEEIENWKKQLR